MQLAKLSGNGLKLFVVFDTCREPKSATEATMKKSRDAKAKLKENDNPTEGKKL